MKKTHPTCITLLARTYVWVTIRYIETSHIYHTHKIENNNVFLIISGLQPVYLNVSFKANQGTYASCNCNGLNANINKSTTLHSIPAVASTHSDDSRLRIDCCPYSIKRSNGLLFECKPFSNDLNFPIPISYKNEPSAFDDIDSDSKKLNINQTTHKISSKDEVGDKCSNNDGISTWPTVSINVIDTDNIHVCMCSQISNMNECAADGGICPECQNIIKKQPVEPRYRLVSKRLVLPNNIIVNRIDTQHLSTYFDHDVKWQDPYTPESAESHSPCPELNSSTSNSNNSRISSSDDKQLLESALFKSENQSRIEMKPQCHSSDTHHSGEDKQQRGTVSAGQLKMRLEDLQKSSKLNFELTNNNDCGDAVESDVEDVDVICLPNNAPVQRYPNSCLPRCCIIH